MILNFTFLSVNLIALDLTFDSDISVATKFVKVSRVKNKLAIIRTECFLLLTILKSFLPVWDSLRNIYDIWILFFPSR